MGEPKLRFKADDGSDFPNWEEKTLGELCEPLTYGMNAAATKFDGENRYIRITDIDDETHAFLSNDVVSPSGELDDKYLVKKGDILLARTGASTGKSYLYHPKDGKLFYAGFLIKAHVLPSSDDYFIYSQTLTDRYGKWVKTTSMRSGQPGINANEYASYSFSVPSLPEQRKIAGLLSTVDDVIAAQEVEVAAWEKRKKGVMQKLFSQEVRFKADDGSDFPDWKEKTLGNLGTFLKGAPLSKSDITDEGTPLILYGELYTTYAEVAYSIARRTDKKVPDKFYSKVGDVVIPTSGETPEEISTATCVMKDGVILAGDLYIYRPATNVDGRILSYLLNHQVNNAISRIAQGKSVVHVQSKELERIHVIFPSSPIEQRKIADCLASLDDVIAKAKDELDAWRELKKGLLQQMFV